MILNEIENTIKDLGKQKNKMDSYASKVFSLAMNTGHLTDEQKKSIKNVKKLTNELKDCRDPKRVNEIISQLNENN